MNYSEEEINRIADYVAEDALRTLDTALSAISESIQTRFNDPMYEAYWRGAKDSYRLAAAKARRLADYFSTEAELRVDTPDGAWYDGQVQRNTAHDTEPTEERAMGSMTKSIEFNPANAEKATASVTAYFNSDETEIESFGVLLNGKAFEYDYTEFVEIKRLFSSFI